MGRILRGILGILCNHEAATTQPEPKDNAFHLEEYKMLRAEILKRTELQQQIINFALIATGAMLTLGSNSNVSPNVLFLHPILMAVFAMAWVDHDHWIGRIAAYLGRVEVNEGLGWEGYLVADALARKAERRGRPMRGRWNEPVRDLAFVSTRTLFLVTDVLAIGLALNRFELPLEEWASRLPGAASQSLDGWLLCIGVAAVVFSAMVLRRRRSRR